MAEAAAADGTVAAPDAVGDRLKITEIFHSIQGESASVGWRTVFIRLTGCPLRCRYCDTAYAFDGGEWKTLDQILDQVAAYKADYVTVTGGEPLAQKRSLRLMERLCDAGYRVSLETSGALDVAAVDRRVTKVMDLKTPDSGECERNRFENLTHLEPSDQVKFVIASREDFDWAERQVRDRSIAHHCQVLYSPSYGELEPGVLADWILESGSLARLQIQLHKVLWGDTPGR